MSVSGGKAVRVNAVITVRKYEPAAYEEPAASLVPTLLDCNPEGAGGSELLCARDENGVLVPAPPRWTGRCCARSRMPPGR